MLEFKSMIKDMQQLVSKLTSIINNAKEKEKGIQGCIHIPGHMDAQVITGTQVQPAKDLI